MKKKKVGLFIRQSAGELEWILPVVHKLISNQADVDLFYLSLKAQKSCHLNSTCSESIKDLGINEKFIFNKKFLFIHDFLDFIFRASFKLNFKFLREFIRKNIIELCLYIFKFYNSELNYEYIFFEIREKSLFRKCLQKLNPKRIFYFPHSPHIYKSINQNLVTKNENISYSDQVKEIYLFGDKYSKEIFIDDQFYLNPNKKSIVIGHPKVSNYWVNYLNQLFNKYDKKDKFDVAILSRGIGNFIDAREQKFLCEKSSQALINNQNINHIWIKYHPREIKNTYWENFSHPKFTKTSMSVAELLQRVDLVIGFWTSAALDAKIFKVPFIEFYRPSLYNKGQIKSTNGFQTIYKELEIVYSAQDITELNHFLEMASRGALQPKVGCPAINEIYNYSNFWWENLKGAF